MCHNVKTIAKNYYGQLSFCANCEMYYLTFTNIYIELTARELDAFQHHVSTLDIEYWEEKYDTMPIKRKIVIKTMQHNLSLMFNRSELAAFKDLLFNCTKKPGCPLSVSDIDYTLFLN